MATFMSVLLSSIVYCLAAAVAVAVPLFSLAMKMAALGKKKKAKDDDRINALDNGRKQHNYHIGRLEQMLRLLDNNDLAPDQVRGL